MLKAVRCVVMITAIVTAINLSGEWVVAQSDYKTGDEIEYDWGRTTYTGKVTELLDNGWIKIKVHKDGKDVVWTVPPRRVKLVKRHGEYDIRLWTDESGEFSVSARLVEQSEDVVKLKKEDGRVVSVPIKKLSAADQGYLNELRKSTDPENPFAGGEFEHENQPGGDSVDSGFHLAEPIAPDRSSAERIVLTDVEWTVEPDARTTRKSADKLKNGVGFRSTSFERPFATRMLPLAISDDESLAAVARHNHSDRKTSHLAILDLTTGNTISSIDLPVNEIAVVAISPDGKTIATSQKSFGSRPTRTDFFALNEDGIKHLLGWKSVGAVKTCFLSQEHFMTVSDSGTITVWDWANSQALSSLQAGRNNGAALSGNNKLLAIHHESKIFIVDLEARKTVGSIPYSGTFNPAFAFSNDGERLAGANLTDIKIWDLTNKGNMEAQMSLTGHRISSSLEWVGQDYLLAGGQSLVSVPLQVVVWNYSGAKPTRGNQGRYWYSIKDREGDGGGVFSIQLPNAGLEKAIENLDPKEMAVIRPGMEISLEFDLPFNPAQQRKIRSSIEDKLENNGFKIVRSGGDLQLTASVVEGKKQKQKYSDFRFRIYGREDKEIEFTPTTSMIVIKKNGQIAWSHRVYNAPPPVVYTSNNENEFQNTIDKHCKPKSVFFTSANLPTSLNRLPGGKRWLGETKLTSSGPR